MAYTPKQRKKMKEGLVRFSEEQTWQQRIDAVKKENNLVDKSKNELAAALAAIEDSKDRLQEKIKQLNTEIEAVVQVLLSKMENEEINAFELQDGSKVSISDTVYIKVANRVKFYEWAKENDMNDIFTVNASTASAIVKDMLVRGEAAPPGVEVFLKQSVGVKPGDEHKKKLEQLANDTIASL